MTKEAMINWLKTLWRRPWNTNTKTLHTHTQGFNSKESCDAVAFGGLIPRSKVNKFLVPSLKHSTNWTSCQTYMFLKESENKVWNCTYMHALENEQKRKFSNSFHHQDIKTFYNYELGLTKP